MKLSSIGSNFYLFLVTTKVIVLQNLGPIDAELNLITSEKKIPIHTSKITTHTYCWRGTG